MSDAKMPPPARTPALNDRSFSHTDLNIGRLFLLSETLIQTVNDPARHAWSIESRGIGTSCREWELTSEGAANQFLAALQPCGSLCPLQCRQVDQRRGMCWVSMVGYEPSDTVIPHRIS